MPLSAYSVSVLIFGFRIRLFPSASMSTPFRRARSSSPPILCPRLRLSPSIAFSANHSPAAFPSIIFRGAVSRSPLILPVRPVSLSLPPPGESIRYGLVVQEVEESFI